MVKSPNEVDRQVGSRVRTRRMLLGMSQEKLADALGITFQQVQKYEKGTNRISASRLEQIARSLSVTIAHLYGDPAPPDAGHGGFSEGSQGGYDADIMTVDALKLLRAYREIKDPKIRRKLVEFAQTLGGFGGHPADERSE